MKEDTYQKIIGYVTDFFVGFFISPFLYFIGRVSVDLIKNESGISDGNAILYVAFLTGIILLLKQDVVFEAETRKKNFLLFILGIVLFWSIYFCI